MTLTLLSLSALVLTAGDNPNPKSKETTMTPHRFHTVELQGGKAWKAGLPPEKQDLAPHFAQVAADFAKGTLLANGPIEETQHGFYVYDFADGQALRSQVESAEEVTKGVVSVVAVEPWQVLIDLSGATPPAGASLYVLEYTPGSRYTRGKPMEAQGALMQAHMGYIGVKTKAGLVYLGGPVDSAHGHGRYVVWAASKTEAENFVTADPAVAGGLFQASVFSWKPLQRQATRGR